jgi:hypothetical protein
MKLNSPSIFPVANCPPVCWQRHREILGLPIPPADLMNVTPSTGHWPVYMQSIIIIKSDARVGRSASYIRKSDTVKYNV